MTQVVEYRPMPDGMVYAKAGATIHDVDGKLVATLVRDVIVGQSVEPDHFQFADGHKPVAGEMIPRAIMLFMSNGPYA